MDADDFEDLFGFSSSLSASTASPSQGLQTSTAPINVTNGAQGAASSSKAAQHSSIASLPREDPPLRLSDEMAKKLFDYQLEGVQWLYRKHCKARACLLADEMGLGKTVQVCVFLGELYRRKVVKSTIIIVPPTLVPMWESVLAQWGDLRAPLVTAVHGENKARRGAAWRKLGFGIPCVLLTTYGVLRQDATSMSTHLSDYVVLDEAHLIKDANTRAFKSALMLSARHKIALTGTPLMNSFEDMWSIFRFLDGSIIDVEHGDFAKISATLLRGNERDATEHQRMAAESELTRLRTAIGPFMLRREKRDLRVVESTKRDLVLWVRLSEAQANQYRAFLATKEVTDSLEDEGSNPLLLLTTLSQICNHPWLTLTEEAFRDALKRPHEAPCEAVGDAFSGSKVPVALALVRRCIAENRKVLLFSRSKRLLHIIARVLLDAGIKYASIDGDINSGDRFGAVKSFNGDPTVPVCLLTTQVGGVGLTFEAASCVVLLDPSWNPSADAQAVDRVHRLGQRRDVIVYRLVTCGTVEEKVYRNQVFKTMAAMQSTMAEEQRTDLFRYFTRLQLRSMFEVSSLSISDTARHLEVLHPGHVPTCVRAAALTVPHVSDVSDHGCVLAEKVAVSDADEAATMECDAGGSDGGEDGLLPGKRQRTLCTPPSLSSGAKRGRVEGGETEETLIEEEVGAMLKDLISADDLLDPTAADTCAAGLNAEAPTSNEATSSLVSGSIDSTASSSAVTCEDSVSLLPPLKACTEELPTSLSASLQTASVPAALWPNHPKVA